MQGNSSSLGLSEDTNPLLASLALKSAFKRISNNARFSPRTPGTILCYDYDPYEDEVYVDCPYDDDPPYEDTPYEDDK